MSNVLDSLPTEYQPLVTEVLADHDQALLTALRATDQPSHDERIAVKDILVEEFCRNLQPDDEPTPRGRDIDNALGAFLLRWPIQNP